MKRTINTLKTRVGSVDEQHLKVGLGVLALILFVLGAGAPAAGGGAG